MDSGGKKAVDARIGNDKVAAAATYHFPDRKADMLNSSQKKYLKGIAHRLKPVVWVGQFGLSPRVIRSTDEALTQHELIKVKFNAFKEKERKRQLMEMMNPLGHSILMGPPLPAIERADSFIFLLCFRQLFWRVQDQSVPGMNVLAGIEIVPDKQRRQGNFELLSDGIKAVAGFYIVELFFRVF